MSKVLLIVSDWQVAMISPGGISSYIDSLTRAFVALGNTVKLLAVVRSDEEDPARVLEAYEPWVIRFPIALDKIPTLWLGRKVASALDILRCSRPYLRRVIEKTPLFKSSVDAINRLDRLLLEENPDVIIFGHFDVRLYPFALCLLERKKPFVTIAHDSEICPFPAAGRHDFVQRQMMLGSSSWIAANSHHTESLMKVWKIPPQRIRLIYPPISQEAMNESEVLGHADRDENQFTLVSICRLVKGKGIDLVMRALKVLDDRGIPYRYFVGGDGPERESLERMVGALGLLGKVHFLGSVAGPEKWRLLRLGDVFVTPSRIDRSARWQEGFGIAFVEAAAFGLPAVASRSGGIPEAVIDGETGILVPEESYVDLANALTLLYEKPDMRKSMGSAARDRAREQFSPKAIANRFRDETSKAVHL
jgi:phosphatidyl-myo-inositol dimannoside synthase